MYRGAVAIEPVKVLLVQAACLLVLVLYFLHERITLDKKLNNIRLRICVTGTRGKSTVARLIASILREGGYRVLAKTTGSMPVLIFPDGTEKEIERKGKPSILEQKMIARLAWRMKADAVVVEMMSIGPEYLRAETQKLLRPHILAITNVRFDHLDDMGRTKMEIAASMASAIPEKGTIFVPEEEFYPVFQKTAEKRATRIVKVKEKDVTEACGGRGFKENSGLALAMTEFVGVRRVEAVRGMTKARPDFGSLKIWKTTPRGSGGVWYLASIFAANEPESTQKALFFLRQQFPGLPQRMIALVNLRADRGDRTQQWLRAVEKGFFDSFKHLVFIGDHAKALGRRKNWGRAGTTAISSITDRRPHKIMERLFSAEDDSGIVIGMGNMGGLGGEVVKHWADIGVSL